MVLELDYENTFQIPARASEQTPILLVSAGPTNPSPRVTLAMTYPPTGACCSEIFQIMDDIKPMLQYVFQTKNEVTLALQTSGTGGLEAALCNTVDPGEKIIVAVGGYWGERMIEKAKVRNIEVVRLESAPNEIFTLKELEKAIITHKPAALLVTHGESSSGTVQNLEGLGTMCHKYNCLLIVDAVVTVGGVPFYTDRWEIDVVVSGSQKAIGAPAGLSLITMSQRAVDRMRNLKCPPPFYYNIVNMCILWNLLQQRRSYYITYNSHLLNALREALIEIVEEGLPKRWERHAACAKRAKDGFKRLGIKCFVENEAIHLNTVNCFVPPPNVVNTDLMAFLHDKHQVAVGFGINKSSFHTLRIGFMGYNARPEVVDYVLKVIEEGIAYCKNKANNKKL